MDKTPSLTRALVGLTLLIAVIAGGYLALKWGSDNENERDRIEEPQVLVRFEGIQSWEGRVAKLTLLTDGTGTVSFRNESRPNSTRSADLALTDKEVRSVVETLEATPLAKKGIIWSDSGCFDCNEYRIEYNGSTAIGTALTKKLQPAVRLFDKISKDALRL
jgi:hypothetical protein